MSKPPTNLMVAVFDHSVCVKITGRADFASSLDLKKLIAELWEKKFNHFIFDLTDCQTMDSTFLGVLSGIGLKFSKGNRTQVGAPLELINPNPRIVETLENLGVADLFAVKTCAEPAADCYEPMASGASKSKLEVTRNCLEAHQTLMSIQPENIQKFKDVTEFLADDLKRLVAARQK